jgi:hypothetical protein
VFLPPIDFAGLLMVVGPFVADHDRRIADTPSPNGRQVAGGVEQHEERLEPERLLQPAERRLAVLDS